MTDYKIERTLTKKNFKNLIIQTPEKRLSIHSLDPIKESERIAKKLNPKIKWTLIAGAGLGYIPDYLLQHSDFYIIVFEHIPELYLKSQQKWKNKSRIHSFSSIDSLINFLEENTIEEMNLYFHRPYVQLFGELYNELEGRLTTILSKRKINQATLYRFQKTWLTNLIKNSRFFEKIPGVCELEKQLINTPIVLAGAGPSLQLAFSDLKHFRNRYVLIAVDTALLPLQNAGIEPDFVVSMDPQDKNAQYLLYAASSSFQLIIDASGHAQIFEKFHKQKLFVSDSIFPVYQTLKSLWGEKGHLKSGGSVSTTAFSLAVSMGASHIILTGQDMAFSDKQIHTGGTLLEEMLYYKIDKTHTYEQYHATTTVFADQIRIEGWDQPFVATDRKFLTYLKWFENEITKIKIPVYQTSVGGAKIKGAIHQSLKDVLNSLPFRAHQTVKLQITPKSVTTSSSKKIETYYKILEDIKKLLPLMDSQLVEIVRLRKAFATKNSSAIRSSLEKLNQNDRKLIKSLKQDNLSAKFVDLTMQKTINDIINSADTQTLDHPLISRWEKLYSDFKYGLLYSDYRLSKTILLMQKSS